VARYTNESRDRVRDAVDFVELVSARTELRRAGPTRYEGLCPFHDERTPSFGIDPQQKVYYCFGCQASGDVFTFVRETEGVDFKGALELLAERCGVELEREAEDPAEAERRRRRERLLELLDRTASYYQRVLWESSEAGAAREYLAGRGLSEQALREFRVGYAPSAWDRVLLASRRGGFSEAELYATGLAQRSERNGQPYDRFRGRIMFPLADLRGKVLGFGARAMREEQRPKYLNTSDNEIYHKGRHLYGADLARAHAAKAGRVILCEGYTDVIALHQAGLRNAVGLMGTALTEEQVGELGRMAQTVLLALDADSAGQEAMLKAYRLAARRKLELRVIELPAGADPAELVQREGPEALAGAVERSAPFVRFRVERVLASEDPGTPEGRDRMIAELRAIFATLPPSAMRLELTQLVSDRLDLPGTLAEQLLTSAAPRPRSTAGAAPAAESAPERSQVRAARVLSARERAERAFLAQCIAMPEEGRRALAEVDVEALFASALLRRAAAHLREQDLEQPLRGVEGEDEELIGLLAELVVEAGSWEEEEGEPQTVRLQVQRLQLELAAIEREIRRARGREGCDVSALARRRAEVRQRFEEAYALALQESGEREL
jgi:DNA primase